MRIEYLHASKYGNGALVGAHFARGMAVQGIDCEVRHIGEVDPAALPLADLYVFSSPGRMGRPIAKMRRFLRKLSLPAGTRYALLTTEILPKPEPDTGERVTPRNQRVRPILRELLDAHGLVCVGEEVAYVTALKGPLEDRWMDKVDAFASMLGADALGSTGDSSRP